MQPELALHDSYGLDVGEYVALRPVTDIERFRWLGKVTIDSPATKQKP
jgi:hypothetical protein